MLSDYSARTQVDLLPWRRGGEEKQGGLLQADVRRKKRGGGSRECIQIILQEFWLRLITLEEMEDRRNREALNCR